MPPLFERDLRMRNRMAHSSYDYMFAKPAMRFLFDDYVNALGRTWLNFRPTEVGKPLPAQEVLSVCKNTSATDLAATEKRCVADLAP